jgi:predicted nucleotidyltransferase
MSKKIMDPKEIFQDIIDDYKGLYGDDLESIILYGSAAGRDYRPGRSDINFMIVLSEEGIKDLDKAFKTIARWKKRRVSTPLFLTRFYVNSSTDVFPIEYLNFKQNHVLVYGEDILNELTFDKKDIRLQCEREIKGKLLLLREAFLESEGKSYVLKEIINDSVQAFVSIFSALLFLKDREIPEDRLSIIKATCEYYEMNESIFTKLMDVKIFKRPSRSISRRSEPFQKSWMS